MRSIYAAEPPRKPTCASRRARPVVDERLGLNAVVVQSSRQLHAAKVRLEMSRGVWVQISGQVQELQQVLFEVERQREQQTHVLHRDHEALRRLGQLSGWLDELGEGEATNAISRSRKHNVTPNLDKRNKQIEKTQRDVHWYDMERLPVNREVVAA